MKNPFVRGVGGVVSADIAVPEHQREIEFYSAILTTGDAPFWQEDLMNHLGQPIIGLGARTPEYDMLPLQWMPHFQVADVAASAASAIELGGTELLHGKDDNGNSQWAVLVDRDGAAFGIIPALAAEADASGATEHTGRISWLSLNVPDASSSKDFYQRVVGWSAKPLEGNDDHEIGFEMQIDDGPVAAEICQCQQEQKEIPPVWLIHLPVGDLAQSLQKVTEFGGSVVNDSADRSGAIIRDPVGVHLALQGD